jgi:mannose-6-phosphate isomerase-like protein (cupin superfamily)
MPLTRREICLLLPAAGLWQGLAPDALADGPALPSDSYPFDKLPVKVSGGAEYRAILKGKLVTGELVEVHETTLGPHIMPHPPHHHPRTEMWLIRQGAVELTINGKSNMLTAGSLGFAASNDEHSIKNAGESPATYFVVAIGPGAGE